ncbi:MAG: hypothetical protein AAFN94_03075 [Pseudomonadota bacterium]
MGCWPALPLICRCLTIFDNTQRMFCDPKCYNSSPLDEDEQSATSWFSPVGSMLAIIFSSVLLVATVGAQKPGTLTLAVFPPSWGAQESFAAASAAQVDTVGFGPADWLLVVHSHDPDFGPRLREEGAVLLLNNSVARFCRRPVG